MSSSALGSFYDTFHYCSIFLSFTHNFAVLSSQISMNAKVDLYMVVIVMLCVITPWAHTNVPVKRDSLEMEKQVAHQ